MFPSIPWEHWGQKNANLFRHDFDHKHAVGHKVWGQRIVIGCECMAILRDFNPDSVLLLRETGRYPIITEIKPKYPEDSWGTIAEINKFHKKSDVKRSDVSIIGIDGTLTYALTSKKWDGVQFRLPFVETRRRSPYDC